ncbi:MAG: Response regulator of zinc sigma-54-dependent two-component system, partial [uncultured Gemmatimonadetes bacterium]
ATIHSRHRRRPRRSERSHAFPSAKGVGGAPGRQRRRRAAALGSHPSGRGAAGPGPSRDVGAAGAGRAGVARRRGDHAHRPRRGGNGGRRHAGRRRDLPDQAGGPGARGGGGGARGREAGAPAHQRAAVAAAGRRGELRLAGHVAADGGAGPAGGAAGRLGRHHGAAAGRKWNGQELGGADDPLAQPAGAFAVRGDQLRGSFGHVPGLRAVRPREGRVHRRARDEARAVRGGGPGHAVPGRDRRPGAGAAAQAAARAGNPHLPPPGRHPRDDGGRAPARRHQQGPDRRGAQRPLSRRLVLPPLGLSADHPPAARPQPRRRAGADAPLSPRAGRPASLLPRAAGSARGHGAGRVRLAGQRPRAAQRAGARPGAGVGRRAHRRGAPPRTAPCPGRPARQPRRRRDPVAGAGGTAAHRARPVPAERQPHRRGGKAGHQPEHPSREDRAVRPGGGGPV